MTNPKASPQISPGQIFCPSCKRPVTLPATSCPGCTYDFRTGRALDPEAAQKKTTPSNDNVSETSGHKVAYIIGGVVMAAIVVMILHFFVAPQPQPNASNEPSPPEINSTTEAFQGLADAPLGARPAIIVNQAKEVVGQLESLQNPNQITEPDDIPNQ